MNQCNSADATWIGALVSRELAITASGNVNFPYLLYFYNAMGEVVRPEGSSTDYFIAATYSTAIVTRKVIVPADAMSLKFTSKSNLLGMRLYEL